MKRHLHVSKFSMLLSVSLRDCISVFASIAMAGFGLVLPLSSLAANYCYKAESIKGPYGEPGTTPIAPVCRALERNLNEFCDEPPLVCNLKIHSKHSGELALPTWTPVEMNGSLKLLEELIRAPWLSAHDPIAATTIWESERPDLEAAFKASRLRVASTQLDMYQTGLVAKVYQYNFGNCTQKNQYLTPSNKNGAWEVKLTSPRTPIVLSLEDVQVLQRQYRPLDSSLGGFVFLYRTKPYMYYMYGYNRFGTDTSLAPTNEVIVTQGVNYLLNDKQTIDNNLICEINYKPGRTK